MTEFDLIRRHFTRPAPSALLGVGDDAALLQVSAGNVLAVSSDMLVSGTHFFADADPFLLGHKALAVNLSDMAAMGAVPRWATLAIALPNADEAWLEKFSAGFFSLAQQHGVELVGGDTTRGPLNLCVTIIGEVPAQQALRRSGAQIGDEVWVSGSLGGAALALAHLQSRIVLNLNRSLAAEASKNQGVVGRASARHVGLKPDLQSNGLFGLNEAELALCVMALHQPQPRVALGLALRGIATSAIDISDGLLADLGHVLDASQVGAEIDFALLPVSDVLRSLSPSPSDGTTSHSTRPPKDGDQVAGYPAGGRGVRDSAGEGGAQSLIQQCVLSGGDDYELCFTVLATRHAEVLRIAAQLGLPLTHIGKVVAGRGCIVHDAAGNPLNVEVCGYDHFR